MSSQKDLVKKEEKDELIKMSKGFATSATFAKPASTVLSALLGKDNVPDNVPIKEKEDSDVQE